jgi:hypothetical protein
MSGLANRERGHMSSRAYCTQSAILALALAVAGCGGGGAEVKTTTTTVSIGQQLIDLKNAHDKGSLSDSEYRKLRQEVIDNAR